MTSEREGEGTRAERREQRRQNRRRMGVSGRMQAILNAIKKRTPPDKANRSS